MKPVQFSFGLGAYLFASRFFAPFANRVLKKRAIAGKEDVNRLDERRGIASAARPNGFLIWLHAASVGEALSLLELVERILDERPDVEFLLTTGTITSAQIVKNRAPMNTTHQFVPLDAWRFVKRFLDHWKPDMAIWTESEFWPNLIKQTSDRGTPMILLNGRMSEQSFKRWRLSKRFFRAMISRFDHVLVQDRQTVDRLSGLGFVSDSISINGSLKESGAPLPHDEEQRTKISEALESRPVWLAASTHEDEEMIAAAAHKIARRNAYRLLLIIAPRHPDRGADIETALKAQNWRVGRRSVGDQPDAVQDIYIADTLGEMGLWYRLAPVSFIGGSLVPVGGHNPYEPAALGSAILHGPYTDNAKEVYEAFVEAGASRIVNDEKELGREVANLLEPHKAADLAAAGWEITSSGAEALDNATNLVLDEIDKIEAAP